LQDRNIEQGNLNFFHKWDFFLAYRYLNEKLHKKSKKVFVEKIVVVTTNVEMYVILLHLLYPNIPYAYHSL